MTHSLYISDPIGYGVEVLYELPREVWETTFRARSITPVPTEGDEAFVDDTDYPTFGREKGTGRDLSRRCP
jgi:catechol-2,3-dioxygenase